jgi:5-methylcytosine-specific restriction endonuclease McrA
MADAIISRDEARAKGLKRYFLGPDRPCKHGHIAERLVSSTVCLACEKQRENRRSANPAHIQKNREKVKAWYAAAAANRQRRADWASTNRDRMRSAQAKYQAEHAAEIAAGQAAYREANRELCRQRSEVWRIANPDKHAAKQRNRHATKKAAEGFHTGEDIQRIYQAQNGKCAYCKTKVGQTYHVDHIQPLSKGGSNWPKNLQILCPTCNGKKHAQDPVVFMQRQGFLL